MSVEVRVPTLGESVTEATVARWLKKAGDTVAMDEPLVELETDKVSLEVPAPAGGTLSEIRIPEGTDVEVGAVIGVIEAAAAGARGEPAPPSAAFKPLAQMNPAGEAVAEATPTGGAGAATPPASGNGAAQAGPAARKLAEERGADLGAIPATGPKGNVTKGDVLAFAAPQAAAPREPAAREPAPPPQEADPRKTTEKPAPAAEAAAPSAGRGVEVMTPSPAARAPGTPQPAAGREERVRMTRLRKRIAERLKEAQSNAAMLTTFNEVDMGAVMSLRAAYQDSFTKKHGIKLGFMGFFVKACIEALRAYPAVNGSIDGDEIVFKHYYDIGVAVSTEQGLVVPVIRDADAKSLAGIEKTIADLGKRARDGKLAMDELTGGTFSITNGGIFGSLMSTPILNPPQSGILGMHKIQDRPMAMPGGKVEVRPMMYLALSYDHRLVDGREAVSFLVRVKECIEDPQRMLIDA